MASRVLNKRHPLARRRVHPVQCLLAGPALTLSFPLLLSLSEHPSFGWACGAAAAGCVVLLGHYGAHVLGGRAAGAAFGAGVALLYGALYALLQMEQRALVIGPLLLFAALAAVMVLTRRIDWYALFDGWRDAAQCRSRSGGVQVAGQAGQGFG
jgi:inner membrane protein